MVEVRLTPSGYSGAQAGVLHQVQNLSKDGSKPRGLENSDSDWQLHIEGVPQAGRSQAPERVLRGEGFARRQGR